MGFLLVNIFLGLLGTFGSAHDAARATLPYEKSTGTSSDIFMLLIGEGLALLTVATPLAVVVDINLSHAELSQYYHGEYLRWGRLLLCAGITYVLMALMISLGISIPAWRAMKTDPAFALRDE